MDKKQSLQDALRNPAHLSVTWELVPGRGAFSKAQEHVARMMAQAASSDCIHAVTLTDSPGGRPAILNYPLAWEAVRLGLEPVVHFTCKDKNRNALESELYALARAGVNNLLVMTGDYPAAGLQGAARPIFDLDPVHVLKLAAEVGAERPFFAGAVVSPFKALEAETIAQYVKLDKKIAAGAQFVISQLGYDARKLDELRRYMHCYHPQVPLVGNVFVLSQTAARLMNANKIPGCVVTDALLAEIEREHTAATASQKKEKQLQRAAKLYAILKGLRYDGVNIGGHGLGYDDVLCIIEQGESLAANWQQWVPEFSFAQSPGFYYFRQDVHSGLNTDEVTLTDGEGAVSGGVRLLQFAHRWLFSQHSPATPLLTRVADWLDASYVKAPLTSLEHVVKRLSNECRQCGDCVMPDTGFLCPMSQCAKQQRNGACGGSRDGWCEVYPGEKQCLYVRNYAWRMRCDTAASYLPPCNVALYRSSSWLNYFTGRSSRRRPL